MRFTRMLILRCMNFQNNDSNSPSSILKKFILGNEIMDCRLCLFLSIISIVILLNMKNIWIMPSSNLSMATLLNITLIINYLLFNEIENIQEIKLPRICCTYWHSFKACIKLFSKVCFIASYSMSLVGVLDYCSQRYILFTHKRFMMYTIFLDFYYFYMGFRFCFFSIKVFINIFLIPIYIAALLIGYYEDKFNLYFNSVINTKVFKGNNSSRNSISSQNNSNSFDKNGPVSSRRKSYLIDMCSICLGDFLEGEYISTLPCWKKHTFHTVCLERWFETKSSCPICRADFQLKIRDFLSLPNNNPVINANMTELNEIFIS